MAVPEGLRHRPLLFVDDLDHPTLTDADYHHFRRVLRVERGAPIVLGDGAGGWRTARFDAEPEPSGQGQQLAAPIH